MVRRIVGGAVTTLLVVAALCLASWFVYAKTTGATLITFRTGSMAPAMPQGALAVTLPDQASRLEPGDVVTVQRAHEPMPVTHRVVEVREAGPQAANAADLRAAAPGAAPPDPEAPEAREIVMQGDANESPDQLPYIVTDVRRVVFSAPGAGNALMLLQTPIGMGALILLVGALVVWAFWPPRPEPESPASHDPEPSTAKT